MKNQRKKHSASFKAQVALEALKERESLSELASRFQVSLQQISKWKNEFKKNSSKIFEVAGKTNDDNKEQELSVLYEKIGKLEMEKEYLKKNLKKLGLS